MWHGNAVTSSTLHADPLSNETIDVFCIKRVEVCEAHSDQGIIQWFAVVNKVMNWRVA